MESTDCTVAIAKSMGCRVVVYPKGNISICEPARNFAIRSASNEWVLVLDADEIVTRELRNYLYKRVSGIWGLRTDARHRLRRLLCDL